MPDFPTRLKLFGSLILAACLWSGCGKWKTSELQWRTSSLLTGPEVKVRILRKSTFSQMEIEYPENAVVLLDGTNTLISPPEDTRHLYLQQQGEQVAVAFKKGKAALQAVPAYPVVRLRSLDHGMKVFKLRIPELGLVREYEGRELILSVKYQCLAVIDLLPLELYLARVLPAEMDPQHFTLEALKAQAVVARTWSLMNLGRHSRYGYHFCDGPHCQVYRGRKLVERRAEQAVKMTLGEVLLYQHHLAEAFYHSTCGGNTVYIQELWGGPAYPYLSRVEDRWKSGNRPYCARSPFSQWTIFTSLRRVERMLRQQRILGSEEKLESLKVDLVNFSGRVKRLLARTDQRRFYLSVEAFRELIDPDFSERKLLSNFFEIEADGNQFSIRGRGLGHGVGMCQWGARGMAQHGFAYQEILSHYFQGTQIGTSYGKGREEVPTALSTTFTATAFTK